MPKELRGLSAYYPSLWVQLSEMIWAPVHFVCVFCLGELGLYLQNTNMILLQALHAEIQMPFAWCGYCRRSDRKSVLIWKFPFVNYFSHCLPLPAAPLPFCTEEDADSLYFLLSIAFSLLISTGDCFLPQLSWQQQPLVKTRVTPLPTQWWQIAYFNQEENIAFQIAHNHFVELGASGCQHLLNTLREHGSTLAVRHSGLYAHMDLVRFSPKAVIWKSSLCMYWLLAARTDQVAWSLVSPASPTS